MRIGQKLIDKGQIRSNNKQSSFKLNSKYGLCKSSGDLMIFQAFTQRAGSERENVTLDILICNKSKWLAIIAVGAVALTWISVFSLTHFDSEDSIFVVIPQSAAVVLTILCELLLIDFHRTRFNSEWLSSLDATRHTPLTFWNSNSFRYLILEMVLTSLQPRPGCYLQDDWLVCITCVRLYHLLRLIQLKSHVYRQRFKILKDPQLALRHVKIGMTMTARVLFYRHTTSFFVISFLLLLFVCAGALFVAESYPYGIAGFWMSMESAYLFFMGAGGREPTTKLGHFITAIVVFVGFTMSQMLGAILTNVLAPNWAQERIEYQLEINKRDQRTTEYAGKTILNWWYYLSYSRRRDPISQTQANKHKRYMLDSMESFRQEKFERDTLNESETSKPIKNDEAKLERMKSLAEMAPINKTTIKNIAMSCIENNKDETISRLEARIASLEGLIISLSDRIDQNLQPNIRIRNDLAFPDRYVQISGTSTPDHISSRITTPYESDHSNYNPARVRRKILTKPSPKKTFRV
eukprot:NODE_1567_length_1902_cov_34.898257_g1327_i0.p1 GENE.NODE_1567_length_1902_cov_34.898257_g1327_i0~~NODE_1567_length_1902_cov_34.898257_g1327_i0.p1  ORF type:complete len:546 (+),score=93.61 NODE_1567_length_1902_cov_34.898257_g1327_i0:75-1640(+)